MLQVHQVEVIVESKEKLISCDPSNEALGLDLKFTPDVDHEVNAAQSLELFLVGVILSNLELLRNKFNMALSLVIILVDLGLPLLALSLGLL